jgi:regulator of PEP synthase PpsR (kinase-PPPase family)
VAVIRPIHALSDATGETAEQACRAALAQFHFEPGEEARIRLFSHVRNEQALTEAITRAKADGALVVYTLVGHGLRDRMLELAFEHGVPAVDLLGNLILEVARHLGRKPLSMPGLGHETDAAYFKRIEAVEFAVKNDDGSQPQNLARAEIVFVGLSRTSKTPLSNYIAHRGYRVANVPLVMNVPPPAELDRVDPRRVFGLVIDPLVLANIRRTRMETLGMDARDGYGDIDHIRQEMRWVRGLFQAHPDWTVLDITRKAIEETASLVLELYRQRFENGRRAEPVPAEGA